MNQRQITSSEFKNMIEKNKILKVEYSSEHTTSYDNCQPKEILFYLDNNSKIELTHLEHYMSIWLYYV